MNRDSAHPHRAMEIHNVAVPVRADGSIAERREADAPHLIQIARRAARDQPGRAERPVRRAHDLTERSSDRRIVQILKDHHRRTVELGEAAHLLV